MPDGTDNIILSPQTWDRILRAVRKIEGLRGHGITNTPGALSIAIPQAGRSVGRGSLSPIFPAKLTSTFSDGYAWTEQEEASDGTFSDLTGGRTSDDEGRNNAFEGNDDESLSADTIVYLVEGRDAETGEFVYGFASAGGIPLGSTQGQVYCMTTNTTAGWDFPRYP